MRIYYKESFGNIKLQLKCSDRICGYEEIRDNDKENKKGK